ncbi:GNAT family N-acetyltransferase [Mycobacterium hodleri]|uniref:hypothetical protein n=1 Tax=Mycolicibacterium hodleri TaxID=49897 RepID=UPI0021F268DB|nr:hypothetical protein [Mycolicibacterium hodleri]MCV7135132.1 GNAT family N-acetyltransferase [Mycolicibacterium hodleri]
MLASEISLLAEAAEAEFMYHYESSAPPATKHELGIATARIGGGVALSMRHDVTGYWSKALGFGVTEPVTAELVDDLVAFYVAQKAPGAVIQIAPALLPHDWPEIARRRDLTPTSPWIKLFGEIEHVQTSHTTDLAVRPVDPVDFPRWAATTLRGFGMPTVGLADMLAEALTHPGFRPFAAWDGDDMVATANLFLHGSVGSLNSTATLETHRSRGGRRRGLPLALGRSRPARRRGGQPVVEQPPPKRSATALRTAELGVVTQLIAGASRGTWPHVR